MGEDEEWGIADELDEAIRVDLKEGSLRGDEEDEEEDDEEEFDEDEEEDDASSSEPEPEPEDSMPPPKKEEETGTGKSKGGIPPKKEDPSFLQVGQQRRPGTFSASLSEKNALGEDSVL